MAAPVAPSARVLAIAVLLAVSMKLNLASDVGVDDGSSLNLLQRRSRFAVAERNSSSKIVFIKTHYTGGTTVTGILQRVCDWQNATCARRKLHGYDGRTLKLKDLPDFVKSYPGRDQLDIWPWHADFDRKAFEELIPGALTVSVFREPVSRMISGMSHDAPWVNRKRYRELVKSLQTNGELCCGDNIVGKCVSPMFVQLQNLSGIDLVMLTEDFDTSLVLLARRLGWPLKNLLYTFQRQSPKDDDWHKLMDEFRHLVSQPLENMTETGRNFMKTCVQQDDELYSAAQKRFQRQLDEMPRKQYAELWGDVARFQAANQVLQDCCTKQPSDPFCIYTTERPADWHYRTQDGKPPPLGAEVAPCRLKALSVLKNESREELEGK